MIDSILAVGTTRLGGFLTAFLVLIAYVFVFVLIIITLMRASRYFKNAGKEQKLLRIEMGKLAEEVHLLRREIKGDKNDDDPA
jgi:cell division protein FtsB